MKNLENALTDAEELVDLKNTDPLLIIKLAAKGMGIIIDDPKPNCKKCYGRGYLGRKVNTGEPIPCSCIFPKETRTVGNFVNCKLNNRKERRHGN